MCVRRRKHVCNTQAMNDEFIGMRTALLCFRLQSQACVYPRVSIDKTNSNIAGRILSGRFYFHVNSTHHHLLRHQLSAASDSVSCSSHPSCSPHVNTSFSPHVCFLSSRWFVSVFYLYFRQTHTHTLSPRTTAEDPSGSNFDFHVTAADVRRRRPSAWAGSNCVSAECRHDAYVKSSSL